jgi:hypothetical protein
VKNKIYCAGVQKFAFGNVFKETGKYQSQQALE